MSETPTPETQAGVAAEPTTWDEPFDPERAKALIEKLRPFEDEATKLQKKLDEWGGEEFVSKAVETRRYLDTDEGAVQLTVEAVEAMRKAGINDDDIASTLGLTSKQVEKAGDAGAAEPVEAGSITPERMEEMLDRKLEEKVLRPQAQQTQAELGGVLREHLKAAGIEDPKLRKLVLDDAEKFWDGTMSKAAVIAAADKALEGHSSWLESIGVPKTEPKTEGQEPQVPKPLAGSAAASGDALPVGKNAKEAAKIAAERGLI